MKVPIICLSSQGWNSNLWTNKQHIMFRLAKKGYPVLYVNKEIHCLGYGPYINHSIYKNLFGSKYKGISALINKIFFKLKIKYKVEFFVSKIPYDEKIINKYQHNYNIDEPYKVFKV